MLADRPNTGIVRYLILGCALRKRTFVVTLRKTHPFEGAGVNVRSRQSGRRDETRTMSACAAAVRPKRDSIRVKPPGARLRPEVGAGDTDRRKHPYTRNRPEAAERGRGQDAGFQTSFRWAGARFDARKPLAAGNAANPGSAPKKGAGSCPQHSPGLARGGNAQSDFRIETGLPRNARRCCVLRLGSTFIDVGRKRRIGEKVTHNPPPGNGQTASCDAELRSL